MIGDLFNYGHLQSLEKGREVSDFHICGVISDVVAKRWTSPLICNYQERQAVLAKVVYVDEVMEQDSLDPTGNLQLIRQRFPDAEILLMQSHHLWSSSLGADYIKEIGGRVAHTDFYHSLSRDYMTKAFFKFFLEKRSFDRGSFNDLTIADVSFYKSNFPTKADTLQRLRSSLAHAVIERLFIFTVQHWETLADGVIEKIRTTFAGRLVVVRSSTLSEDSLDFSNAGFYHSELGVNADDADALSHAIRKVIASYHAGGSTSFGNQVLVQEQTSDILLSGVIFTRNLLSNAPYYVVNYDDVTIATDGVTSGGASKKIEIVRDIPHDATEPRWRSLLTAVQEIESFFQGISLDIEFAIKTDGAVVVFQVRPLAANSRFYSPDDDLVRAAIADCQALYGRLASEGVAEPFILSDMAFWNPAELIGDRPNRLDYSLFDHLIMKETWNEALLPLGYTKVEGGLMVMVANKPYIDVQRAFLCLMPAALPEATKKTLLRHYLQRLKGNPELHDKIEFEIVHNCYTFDIEEALGALQGVLTGAEITTLKQLLLHGTNGILAHYQEVAEEDLRAIAALEKRFLEIRQASRADASWSEKLSTVCALVEDCREAGIAPFTRLARMAFIGNALLRSLVKTGALAAEEVSCYMNTINTVATELDADFGRLRSHEMECEAFGAKYGHLRPGTYDITKLPYAKSTSYFCTQTESLAVPRVTSSSAKDLHDTTEVYRKLSQLCDRHGLLCGGATLLDFISRSIRLREYFKFVYTKNISEAIELIASVGASLGFSREQMANLDYYTIVSRHPNCTKEELTETWKSLIDSRSRKREIMSLVSLPAIIFSESDFVMVSSHSSTPNFITDQSVQGEAVLLDQAPQGFDLTDKIVVLEKADPGFDWIFTKRIRALVTKYGGVASHMSIRCAEFDIPAAIGCGEMIFSRVQGAQRVAIDCRNKTINVI